MAGEDVKGKKRKGAVDAAPKAKKQKKVNDPDPAATSKPTKAPKQVPETETKTAKASRKKAQDFFDEEPVPVASTKGKKHKQKEVAVELNGSEIVEDTATNAPKLKAKSKESKKKDATENLAGEEQVPGEAAADKASKSKLKKCAKHQESQPEAVHEVSTAQPAKSKGRKANASGDASVEASEKDKPTTEDASAASAGIKSSKSNKSQKKRKEDDEPNVVNVVIGLDEEDVDAEEDDQTAALLAGFESDGDEADPPGDKDFEEDPAIQVDTSTQKALKKAGKHVEKAGVVYDGRIPHGFYETQMKQYFSQFGTVNRLRLSRNKKTGASKHYAFVEFASEEVADIVARTMHNYLLFGHQLQCRVIPREQIHENLFKGANERFKVMPRNRIAGADMARGAERQVWEKRTEKEGKRRSLKNKKLKEEFDYEFAAPKLKTVADVPKQARALADPDTEQLLVEAPAGEVVEKSVMSQTAPGQVELTEIVKVKKGKRGSKTKDKTDTETLGAEVESAIATDSKPAEKKSKKSKKETKDELPAGEEVTKVKKSKTVTDEAGDETTVQDKKRKKASVPEGSKPKKAKKSKA